MSEIESLKNTIDAQKNVIEDIKAQMALMIVSYIFIFGLGVFFAVVEMINILNRK